MPSGHPFPLFLTQQRQKQQPSPPPPGKRYGAQVSASGRYFVDQYGAPWFEHLDSPWGLLCDLPATEVTTNDMGWYMDVRAGQGFNAMLVQLLCGTISGGPSDTTFQTRDGVAPFTSTAYTTPNSTYWSRCDAMLSMAEARGITMLMYPLDTFQSAQRFAALSGGGTTEAYNFGLFLGNRYKTRPNIMWAVGGDYDNVSGGPSTTYDAVQKAVLDGIRDAGDNHLRSISLTGFPQSNSFDYPAWDNSYSQYSMGYTYNPTYDTVLKGYAHTYPASPTARPVIFYEGNYEGENNKSFATSTDANLLRRSYGWAMTSGAAGVSYGAGHVWPFWTGGNGTWYEQAVTGGSWGTVAVPQLKVMRDWFTSLSKWHLLVPDTGSALVTAGRGSYVDGGTGNPSGNSNTDPRSNNYVTASVTADGTLAVIYLPDASSAITVSWSPMAASNRTATWVDPTSGATVAGTAGATSYSRTANAAGGSDWLLMLTGA